MSFAAEQAENTGEVSPPKGRRLTTKSGLDVYIPTWTIPVALENLTSLGKILGTDSVVAIASGSVPATLVAVMGAKDELAMSALVRAIVATARVDGKRLDANNLDAVFGGNLLDTLEVFTKIIEAQYADFFERGLE